MAEDRLIVDVRTLLGSDATAWWNLRLEALRLDPLAFSMSIERHLALSVDAMAERFRESSANTFTLGAFIGEGLAGMATFVRDSGIKERQKGAFSRVYVTPTHRGHGIARAMLEALLGRVREDSGIEQILR